MKVKKSDSKIKAMVMKTVGTMATNAAQQNANQRCAWFIHQPKMPKSVKKLRKF